MTNGRCRIHGGKSLGGIASPLFTHGRYSKYLPQRIQAKYQESLADPGLLAVRNEIALVDARMEDLLSKVDASEAGEMWRKLRKLAGDCRKAGPDDAQDALDAVLFAIDKGAEEWQTWNEIIALVGTRLKCVETETRRLEKMGQMIANDQALAMMTTIGMAINEHVKDKDARRALAEVLRKVMGA